MGFKLGFGVKIGRMGKIGKIFFWKNEEKVGCFLEIFGKVGHFFGKMMYFCVLFGTRVLPQRKKVYNH